MQRVWACDLGAAVQLEFRSMGEGHTFSNVAVSVAGRSRASSTANKTKPGCTPMQSPSSLQQIPTVGHVFIVSSSFSCIPFFRKGVGRSGLMGSSWESIEPLL